MCDLREVGGFEPLKEAEVLMTSPVRGVRVFFTSTFMMWMERKSIIKQSLVGDEEVGHEAKQGHELLFQLHAKLSPNQR